MTSFGKIQKTFPSRGQYTFYRLVKPATFICSRCEDQKKSNLVAYDKDKSEEPLCSDCYNHAILFKEMDGKSNYSNATSATMKSHSPKIYTPTHTADPDDWERSVCDTNIGVVDAAPCAGETFAIRHKGTGRAIAVNDDGDVRLALFDNAGTSSSCHWKCVEKDGWFGFKHEGRYLGRDGNGGFQAEVKHHKAHEYFCAKKHPVEGYYFMTLHGWAFHKMAVGKDGRKLIEVTDEGALWEFLKI